MKSLIKYQRGFTLIELLIVVGLIGLICTAVAVVVVIAIL